jgi:hypothetical protein
VCLMRICDYKFVAYGFFAEHNERETKPCIPRCISEVLRTLCRASCAAALSQLRFRDNSTPILPFLLKTCAWTPRFSCQGSPASLR